MNLSSKSKILFLTHYYFRVEGGGDTDERIMNYLKKRAGRVVLITNPFPESKSTSTYCFVYENGRKVKEIAVNGIKGNIILVFLNQIFITFSLLFKIGFKYDLCIAANNFSVIMVYPLRAVKLINKLIFYSIDFVPNRYQNVLLDHIYHLFYKWACRLSDITWVMAKEQITATKKADPSLSNKTIFDIVPIGYDLENLHILPTDKIDYYNLVYMGGLIESHGPQLAIEALPYLLKENPRIILTIIGRGNFLDYLEKLAKKLKVEKKVNFKGYIENFKDLTDNLVTKSIGLAPYKPATDSFSFFSDPSKIKLYMVCGLPVITTHVATMADLINKTKSGVAINYAAKELADAVLFILNNRIRYSAFKKAAVKLSSKFDINVILRTALEKVPN